MNKKIIYLNSKMSEYVILSKQINSDAKLLTILYKHNLLEYI